VARNSYLENDAKNVLSRRGFLGTSLIAIGGLAGLGGLAGCGSDETSGSTSGGGTSDKSPFLAADYGGLTTKAWAASVYATFTKRTGVRVTPVPLDYGKWVAQIKSGKTSWGWADAIGYLPFQYPELFEDVPWDKLGVQASDLYQPLGAAPSEKSALQYLSSYVIGYRTDKNPKAPATWAEFFDTKAIPGKRAIMNGAYGMLEVALLADGVPFKDLYPLDLKRAFAKLDTIKSELAFWNTGAESQQLLVNDAADFVVGYNNRFSQLADQGVPAEISWGQNLQILDVNVIPKNYARPELVVAFIKAALDPAAQAEYAKRSLNAPSNKKAYALLDEKTKSRVSTNPKYLDMAVGAMNDKWWAENLDDVSNQWTAWAGA
jgi:putative spermidine/putrescine transport system substrate-binding protein